MNYLPLLCGIGIAFALPNDPPMLLFDKSSNLQITIVYSLLSKDKPPVEFAIRQLGFHGNRGYDYTTIVESDIVPSGPEWEDLWDKNLLFKDGTVMEETLKDKTWVKYPCDNQTFLGWLDYVYSGACLVVGFAQYAVQQPDKFTVTDAVDSITYVPRAGASHDEMDGMEKVVKSISIGKTPSRLLKEIVIRPDPPLEPGNPGLSEKYLYGMFNPAAANSLKLPTLMKEIANPLNSRMEYP